MNTLLLQQNIAKHIQHTNKEFSIFESLLSQRIVKAKQPILQEGMVCRQSIFVVKGILRGYSNDKNGMEHVLSFAPEGWWIADMYSLISGLPGTLNIETIEDAELLLLSKENQDELYEKVPKFERYF